MGKSCGQIAVIHPALYKVRLDLSHHAAELAKNRQTLTNRCDIKRTDRNSCRFEFIGIRPAAVQADDTLLEAPTLQSDRGFGEHAFSSAKPKPTDYMQDSNHLRSYAKGGFGCNSTKLFNAILSSASPAMTQVV